MLLLFTTALPPSGPRDAVRLWEEFGRFNASLRPRMEGGAAPGGGYYPSVPAGREPLRTMRRLQDTQSEWELLGVDDDGNRRSRYQKRRSRHSRVTARWCTRAGRP
jgi:hypothetical protein